MAEEASSLRGKIGAWQKHWRDTDPRGLFGASHTLRLYDGMLNDFVSIKPLRGQKFIDPDFPHKR